MGDIKIYSPFYKVRKTLKLLRCILGFPLKPSNESFTEFIFNFWLEIFRFLIILVIPTILHIYLFIVFITLDGTLENFTLFYYELYTHYSTSILDIIVVIIWTLVISISMVAYLVIFCRSTETINQFCNEFCMAKSKLGSLLQRHKIQQYKTCTDQLESSHLLLIFGQILTLIATSMFTAWLFAVVKIISKDHEGYPLLDGVYAFGLLLLYMLQVSNTLFGPLSCAVELINCHIINELADLFDDWQKLLRISLPMIPYQVEECGQIDQQTSGNDKRGNKR